MTTDRILREEKIPFKTSDEWDLVRIIVKLLSYRDPNFLLKEFVDNAFDAFSKRQHPSSYPKQIRVTIWTKDERYPHIAVFDNGSGWKPHGGVDNPKKGMPDFEYTVTHIGNSVKSAHALGSDELRNGGLRHRNAVGLFSFWRLGERLTVYSRSTLENGQISPCSMMTWLKEARYAKIVHDVEAPTELSNKAGSLVVIARALNQIQ